MELFETEPHFSFLPKDAPHVEFDHVTFRYARGSFAVRNIDFALKRGETLGIIGAIFYSRRMKQNGEVPFEITHRL